MQTLWSSVRFEPCTNSWRGGRGGGISCDWKICLVAEVKVVRRFWIWPKIFWTASIFLLTTTTTPTRQTISPTRPPTTSSTNEQLPSGGSRLIDTLSKVPKLASRCEKIDQKELFMLMIWYFPRGKRTKVVKACLPLKVKWWRMQIIGTEMEAWVGRPLRLKSWNAWEKWGLKIKHSREKVVNEQVVNE